LDFADHEYRDDPLYVALCRLIEPAAGTVRQMLLVLSNPYGRWLQCL
jgi:hypothetical protein